MLSIIKDGSEVFGAYDQVEGIEKKEQCAQSRWTHEKKDATDQRERQEVRKTTPSRKGGSYQRPRRSAFEFPDRVAGCWRMKQRAQRGPWQQLSGGSRPPRSAYSSPARNKRRLECVPREVFSFAVSYSDARSLRQTSAFRPQRQASRASTFRPSWGWFVSRE